jgi:hypothetical protein
MGNTYNATTYDLYAIGKNPGLLAKTHAPCKVTFIFPNLTAQQYGISNTLNTFDYYGTKEFRRNELATFNDERILVALDHDGKMFADGLLGFFSVAYHHNERIGSFAFNMVDYMASYMIIPKVVMDINYGQEVPEGSLTIDDFKFKASWIRAYSLSYSRYIYKDRSIYRANPGLIKSVLGGISVKYLNSFAYTDIGLSVDAYYSSGTQTLSGSYDIHAIHSFSPDLAAIDPFNDEVRTPKGFISIVPAGRGYAFDIGTAVEFRKGWTVGLSVTDLGRIRWEGLAAESDFAGNFNFSGAIDNQTLDSLAVDIALENKWQESFSTSPPTALRLGVSLKFEEMFDRFPGELLAGIDYNQGLNDEPSNFESARFSLGLHYRPAPKAPIILAGYTIDLLGVSRGSLGLGYSIWLVDVYLSTIDMISYVNGDDRFSASFVARWKILCGHRKNKGPDCF